MEEYNFQFIFGTLPAVMFILTLGIGGTGGGRPGRMTRTPVRRLPQRTSTTPPATAPAQPSPQPGAAGRSSTAVPSTGTRGNPAASVRDVEARAAQRAPVGALTPAQQSMVNTLIREHGGLLHPNVGADAVRGAARVMGPGGRGADIVLLNGGGREVSIHSGAFTPQGVASHLLEEAAQVGTTEIYLQINTGTREGFLRMLPGLRSGYAELQGVFVKIFGPDGQVWWNGIFRGLR